MQLALQNALLGMQDAQRRSAISSHNLANLNTENFAPLRADGQEGQPGSMDVASEVVDSIASSRAFEVNAKAMRIADETFKSLIDIRA